MVMGKDFEVGALITNNYMKTKSCKVVFMASAVGYNGKLGEYCGFSMVEVELAPDEGNTVAHHSSLSGSKKVSTVFVFSFFSKTRTPETGVQKLRTSNHLGEAD